ncbi:MAG: helix-turn-helix domain-containing protein [Candidatus Eremiobacterota bacterium]
MSLTKRNPVASRWTPLLAERGAVPVARAFLDAVAGLRMSPAEVLLVICLVASGPRPSVGSLSRKLGVCPRTVRSWASRLERKGLLKRIMRRKGHGRAQTNLWDLSPLFERLEDLERSRRQEPPRAARSLSSCGCW